MLYQRHAIRYMIIKEWVPGSFPVPFFQTWCCKHSSVTPPIRGDGDGDGDGDGICRDLMNAGLPPKMYECVRDNLVLNNVGVDCIHYLFNDAACREFIAREYPPDVLFAYDRLIPTAFKADLWRYCVLYKYGGIYMDIKLRFTSSLGDASFRGMIERWLACSESRHLDSLLVLERDAPGLWPPGHFGIHNAFIITRPKNQLFLNCIFRIVSLSKVGGLGGGVGDDIWNGVGWMTRPLFVTGPGLLGDMWRGILHAEATSGGWTPRDSGDGVTSSVRIRVPVRVPDSYATMAPYFRLFFQGNGVISYFIDPEDSRLDDGKYIEFLKVYDEYRSEIAGCDNDCNRVPHYTLLWSRGGVWRGAEAVE
jgi:hypothetical protein